MKMSATEKIRTIMRRYSMTGADVAEATGQTRQNLANKLARDDLKESEIEKLAQALGCSVEVVFTLPDGSQL